MGYAGWLLILTGVLLIAVGVIHIIVNDSLQLTKVDSPSEDYFD